MERDGQTLMPKRVEVVRFVATVRPTDPPGAGTSATAKGPAARTVSHKPDVSAFTLWAWALLGIALAVLTVWLVFPSSAAIEYAVRTPMTLRPRLGFLFALYI
jgi:hypothetical protein